MIEGGAAILQAEKQNHQKVKEGNIVRKPDVRYILRDCVVSYVMLAKENIEDEQNPCAISIVRAPCQPHLVFDIIPPVARPICLTEEYAISDLTSVCRKQINLARAPPIVQTTITGEDNVFDIIIIFVLSRSNPYLPNFNKIPARTIEPATGASTCAFGSQRCTRKRGVFTKNATIVRNHQILAIGRLE